MTEQVEKKLGDYIYNYHNTIAGQGTVLIVKTFDDQFKILSKVPSYIYRRGGAFGWGNYLKKKWVADILRDRFKESYFVRYNRSYKQNKVSFKILEIIK